MIYSVWSPTRRSYDYYETPEPTPTHTPARGTIPSSSKLGATPEQAAWRLPMGARRVGSGPTARGRIAQTGMGAVEIPRTALVIGGLVAAAWLGRKVLR